MSKLRNLGWGVLLFSRRKQRRHVSLCTLCALISKIQERVWFTEVWSTFLQNLFNMKWSTIQNMTNFDFIACFGIEKLTHPQHWIGFNTIGERIMSTEAHWSKPLTCLVWCFHGMPACTRCNCLRLFQLCIGLLGAASEVEEDRCWQGQLRQRRRELQQAIRKHCLGCHRWRRLEEWQNGHGEQYQCGQKWKSYSRIESSSFAYHWACEIACMGHCMWEHQDKACGCISKATGAFRNTRNCMEGGCFSIFVTGGFRFSKDSQQVETSPSWRDVEKMHPKIGANACGVHASYLPTS